MCLSAFANQFIIGFNHTCVYYLSSVEIEHYENAIILSFTIGYSHFSMAAMPIVETSVKVIITHQITFSDCFNDLAFIISNCFERLYDYNCISVLTFFSCSIC